MRGIPDGMDRRLGRVAERLYRRAEREFKHERLEQVPVEALMVPVGVHQRRRPDPVKSAGFFKSRMGQFIRFGGE